MAKKILEKLNDAITAAIVLRDAAVIGDQEGQYAPEAVDDLSVAVEAAKTEAAVENAEDAQLEAALASVVAAVKTFKGTVVKPAENPPEHAGSAAIVSLKGVVLKGTDSEKKGVHTLFAYGGTVVFHDGEANVSNELAGKLISDGFAEEGQSKAGE